MEKEHVADMIGNAFQAMEHSYAPYSKFHVGAYLKTKQGHYYSGCNVENASFSVTNCAERTAIFKAVSEGEKEFESIAIVGRAEGGKIDFCPPCGVCLQAMMEFCDPEKFQVILAKSEKEYKILLLKDLLPMGFGTENLE